MPVYPITIRPASQTDATVIAQFNRQLALETEGLHLDSATVEAGVRAALDDSRLARYFLAEVDGHIAGQLMHTWEWSDWRNGSIWWLQSVYVTEEFRRRGVFRALQEHLVALARSEPGVVGLRLYMEHDNTTARDTYQRLGYKAAGYEVLELMLNE